MQIFVVILENITLSVAHQDTFIAIGALSQLMKSNFKKYIVNI